MCWQPHLTWRHVTHMSYHWLLRFDSGDVFLVCRNDTVSSEKREKTVALSKGVENVFFLAFLFVCLCSDSLAGDASSWWKSWHLLRSQEFDDVQKIGVLLSGPHHLDDFCEVRIKMVVNEEANRRQEWRVLSGATLYLPLSYRSVVPALPPSAGPLESPGGRRGSRRWWCWCYPGCPAEGDRAQTGQSLTYLLKLTFTLLHFRGKLCTYVLCIVIMFISLFLAFN